MCVAGAGPTAKLVRPALVTGDPYRGPELQRIGDLVGGAKFIRRR